MKYGIDIYNEWHDVPDSSKGIRYFDNIEEAIKWGEDHTWEDDGIYYGFYIFEVSSDKIIYQKGSNNTLFKEGDGPINSRFDILDIRKQ